MNKYIEAEEKLVARLGGAYSPGVKNAPKSLELTDKRIYFSAASAPTKEDKATHFVSTVVDAADVSSITYTFDKPKGSFLVGTLLMILSFVIGAVLGVMQFLKDKLVPSLIIPIGVGLGAGIFLLIICYVVTYFINKSKRAVIVAVEYAGLIVRTTLIGVNDEKLDCFREGVFKVKDALKRGANFNVYSPNEKTAREEKPDVFDDIPIERPVADSKKKPLKNAPKRKMKETVDLGDL